MSHEKWRIMEKTANLYRQTPVKKWMKLYTAQHYMEPNKMNKYSNNKSSA